MMQENRRELSVTDGTLDIDVGSTVAN